MSVNCELDLANNRLKFWLNQLVLVVSSIIEQCCVNKKIILNTFERIFSIVKTHVTESNANMVLIAKLVAAYALPTVPNIGKSQYALLQVKHL